MSRCRKIQKRLSAYLDGECVAQEKRRVEEHLETCETCRQELRELERVWGSLGTWVAPAAPADMRARFWTRAREKSLRGRRMSWVGVPKVLGSWVSAVCVLGLLVGIYVGSLVGKPATLEPAGSANGEENMREIVYLADIPSGSLTEAYMTVVTGAAEIGDESL